MHDGRIPEPGEFGLDLHYDVGRHGRLEDGGAPRNGSFLTTELSYAITPWYAVALYLPVARDDSGRLFGGGTKLRNTFVVPGEEQRAFAYAFDLELRRQPYRFSESDWAVSLRPILDLRHGPFQLILNGTVEMPLGRGGPVLAPSWRGVLQVAERTWLGVEHYMEFGRTDRIEKPPGQAHQLFGTVDLRVSDRVGLHFGVGHGLTRASDRWAGKVILSIDF